MSTSTPLSAGEQKVWSLVGKIFEYFERLGIAIAVGAGGMAVIKFREQLFPEFALVPGVIGSLLILAAFFLLVFAAGASVREMFGNKKGWIPGFAMLLYITFSLFFVRAGFALAANTLNTPSASARAIGAAG